MRDREEGNGKNRYGKVLAEPKELSRILEETSELDRFTDIFS